MSDPTALDDFPDDDDLAPYPGLRPFEAEEDYLFFGREGQSDELLLRLKRTRFLAVVGTSGSGKSSLVKAGLLPALYSGFMTSAGSSWRVALMRPGDDPFGQLAHALSAPEVLGRDQDEAASVPLHLIVDISLRRSDQGLVQAAREARMPARQNLLILVDQFEELFRFEQLTQRGRCRRLREIDVSGHPAGRDFDLRGHHHALGLSGRLLPPPRPARGHQRRPVPGGRA